jgi:glycosyltransferase involved in cell wall biosynthesis
LQKWEGGVGVVAKNIKKELEVNGHEVKVISRQNDLGIYSFLKSIFKLRKIVNRVGKNYDIIYTQDWGMTLPLLLPIPLLRKKHFCCFHGIQPGPLFLLQKITGKLMGRKLIVIGDSLKEIFPKSNLIFNGARLDIFKPIKKIKKIKNSVGFANWKIKVYNYEKIKKAVEESGKKFMVAEGIPYEKMPEFYNQVETFISLPPLYTSCAMVWLEALACGVPKIIGNHAGIRFPINYIEDFKDIKDALHNALEKDSKKFPFEKFTWKYHTSNLLNVFKGKNVEGKY